VADIAKSGTPSICTAVPCPAHTVANGITAGEALAAGDACRIHTDGKAYKATGAAANASAVVAGFAAKAAALNGAVTLYTDLEWHYGSGMTPGTRIYLSGAVAGAIADAASTGGTAPIGQVIDATRVRLWASRY
jgi:hypothetical protein